MATKTVSTVQAAQQLDATHYLQVHTAPCVIYSFEGYVGGVASTQYWLQIHGVVPTTGVTVPLYSVQILGINGFSFVYPDGLDTAKMSFPVGAITTAGGNTLPVFFAVSSTDAVYTSVAASTSLSVTLDAPEVTLPNETIVGDSTTGVDSLAVYTDPNPANRLVRFEVANNTGAVGYLMLFGYAAPANGAIPIAQWKIADGATLTQQFGGGLLVEQGLLFVQHYGCYLYGSSTTQVLTATAATNWTMKAWKV